MTKIYEQHAQAFSNVSAYLATNASGQELKISFKYPKDGAGRLWVYFHYVGLEMVRDYAGGYGYDKASAAINGAIEKITVIDDPSFSGQQWYEMSRVAYRENVKALQDAFKNIGGKDWKDVLRDNGYKVYSII